MALQPKPQAAPSSKGKTIALVAVVVVCLGIGGWQLASYFGIGKDDGVTTLKTSPQPSPPPTASGDKPRGEALQKTGADGAAAIDDTPPNRRRVTGGK